MSEAGIPLVSVVMPTRNRAALLERAVKSVLDQTFRDWELIIIDDASTDATAAVVSEYCSRDARVRMHTLTTSRGGAAARNAGIAAARGAWIAFLDDDDEWYPRKLAEQIHIRDDSPAGAGFIYCLVEYANASGHRLALQSSGVSDGEARRALLRQNFICTPSVLIRRDVLEATGGFDDRLPRLQDWDLWIRVAAVTRFACVPLPLVRVHHTPVSISTNSEALATACGILDDKFTDTGMDEQEYADFLHALGHMLMIGGAPSHGPNYLWRSVKLGPVSLRRTLMAVLATASGRLYAAVSRSHERVVRLRATRAPARVRS